MAANKWVTGIVNSISRVLGPYLQVVLAHLECSKDIFCTSGEVLACKIPRGEELTHSCAALYLHAVSVSICC